MGFPSPMRKHFPAAHKRYTRVPRPGIKKWITARPMTSPAPPGTRRRPATSRSSSSRHAARSPAAHRQSRRPARGRFRTISGGRGLNRGAPAACPECRFPGARPARARPSAPPPQAPIAAQSYHWDTPSIGRRDHQAGIPGREAGPAPTLADARTIYAIPPRRHQGHDINLAEGGR